MTSPLLSQTTTCEDLAVLREVENRVLWLSTALIDHANRVRPNTSGLKVGGHQASRTLPRAGRRRSRAALRLHELFLAAASRAVIRGVVAVRACADIPGLHRDFPGLCHAPSLWRLHNRECGESSSY